MMLGVRCGSIPIRAQILSPQGSPEIQMETYAMSANRPKLELAFRSFKLSAEGSEAVYVVKWPARILLVAIAVCPVIVVLRTHPIGWGRL